MSMNIKTVSDKDIETVKANPIKLSVLHYGDIYEDELEDFEDNEKTEILNWKPEINGEVFYIEAAFESLHYLLTGQSEWNSGKFPLNFLTGQRLCIGEIGWGPARFYYSKEVKEIYVALKELNKDTVIEFYSSVDFNSKGIYPRGYIWKDNDGIELMKKLNDLIDFLSKAVNDKRGIYLTIT
jgi:hypothetical protein